MRPLILALCLTGCSPYWVKDHDPVEVKSVHYVNNIACQDAWGVVQVGEALGCANYLTGEITILNTMNPQDKECVLQHELAHFKGWSHDGRQQYAISCGPDLQ